MGFKEGTNDIIEEKTYTQVYEPEVIVKKK